MNMEFLEALRDLEKEKGVAVDVLIEAIESALFSAYKRNFGSLQNVRVHVDRETGDFKVYAQLVVTETVEDERTEISLENARAINPSYCLLYTSRCV